uniref:Uncharacterized protein n=1 Tax=Anguilla anguilla TaxID=7936 RepID=A0A0E9QZJ8_ANGAN
MSEGLKSSIVSQFLFIMKQGKVVQH